MSHTMFLVHGHNTDIKLARASNEGMLNARFEPAEELHGTDIEIHGDLSDETDQYDFPSVANFVQPDNFAEIRQQLPPLLEEIAVAFPTQHNWQELEEAIKFNDQKRFMATPPAPTTAYEQLTSVQKMAVQLVVSRKHPVIYIVGKAGSGEQTFSLYNIDVCIHCHSLLHIQKD